MMFLLDLAFAIELIALGLGLAFIVWALRNKGAGQTLASFTGGLITILALFGLACTSYYGLSYWTKGYFSEPFQYKMKNARVSNPVINIDCPMAKKMMQMQSGMQDDAANMPMQGSHMQGMPQQGQMMPGMKGKHMQGQMSPGMKGQHMKGMPEQGQMMPGMQGQHMQGMPEQGQMMPGMQGQHMQGMPEQGQMMPGMQGQHMQGMPGQEQMKPDTQDEEKDKQ